MASIFTLYAPVTCTGLPNNNMLQLFKQNGLICEKSVLVQNSE